METGKIKNIVIRNCCIGEWDGFSYPDEAVICLRHLVNYPDTVLRGKYNLDTKSKYLMFLLPYIAKLFKIDRKKLLDEYINEYMYWDCCFYRKK